MESVFHNFKWCFAIAVLCIAVLLSPTRLRADSTYTLDFESFSDSTLLTTQYSSLGLTFSNAIALSSGISLNEFDFPPHSGSNVVSDNGGPINLAFAFPASFVGAFFTYLEPLKIDAFNSNGQLIASATSTFSANDVNSGNPPNEFLSVAAPGIADVTFTADLGGSSFTMDDLSLTIPEPSAFWLLGTGIAAFTMLRRRICKA